MTAFALGLVLASAFAHATWNFFAKRASGGAPFLWLAFALSIPLYAPIAIAVLIVSGARIGPLELLCMFVNAALNVAYGIFLLRGYRAGDLSVVYPLARGTAMRRFRPASSRSSAARTVTGSPTRGSSREA